MKVMHSYIFQPKNFSTDTIINSSSNYYSFNWNIYNSTINILIPPISKIFKKIQTNDITSELANNLRNLEKRATRTSCFIIHDILSGKSKVKCEPINSFIMGNHSSKTSKIIDKLIDGTFQFPSNSQIKSFDTIASPSLATVNILARSNPETLGVFLNDSFYQNESSSQYEPEGKGIEVLRMVELFPNRPLHYSNNTTKSAVTLTSSVNNSTNLKSNISSPSIAEMTEDEIPNEPILPHFISTVFMTNDNSNMAEHSLVFNPSTKFLIKPSVTTITIPKSSLVENIDVNPTIIPSTLNEDIITQLYNSSIAAMLINLDMNNLKNLTTVSVLTTETLKILHSSQLNINKIRPSTSNPSLAHRVRTVVLKTPYDKFVPLELLINTTEPKLNSVFQRALEILRNKASFEESFPQVIKRQSNPIEINGNDPNLQNRVALGNEKNIDNETAVNITNVYFDQIGGKDVTMFDYFVTLNGDPILATQVTSILNNSGISMSEGSRIMGRNIIILAEPYLSNDNPLQKNLQVTQSNRFQNLPNKEGEMKYFRLLGRNTEVYTRREKGRIAGIILGIFAGIIFVSFLLLFLLAALLDTIRRRHRNRGSETSRVATPIVTITKPSSSQLHSPTLFKGDSRKSQAPSSPSLQATPFFKYPFKSEDSIKIPVTSTNPLKLVNQSPSKPVRNEFNEPSTSKFYKNEEKFTENKAGIIQGVAYEAENDNNFNNNDNDLKGSCENLRKDLYSLIDRSIALLFSFIDNRERDIKNLIEHQNSQNLNKIMPLLLHQKEVGETQISTQERLYSKTPNLGISMAPLEKGEVLASFSKSLYQAIHPQINIHNGIAPFPESIKTSYALAKIQEEHILTKGNAYLPTHEIERSKINMGKQSLTQYFNKILPDGPERGELTRPMSDDYSSAMEIKNNGTNQISSLNASRTNNIQHVDSNGLNDLIKRVDMPANQLSALNNNYNTSKDNHIMSINDESENGSKNGLDKSPNIATENECNTPIKPLKTFANGLDKTPEKGSPVKKVSISSFKILSSDDESSLSSNSLNSLILTRPEKRNLPQLNQLIINKSVDQNKEENSKKIDRNYSVPNDRSPEVMGIKKFSKHSLISSDTSIDDLINRNLSRHSMRKNSSIDNKNAFGENILDLKHVSTTLSDSSNDSFDVGNGPNDKNMAKMNTIDKPKYIHIDNVPTKVGKNHSIENGFGNERKESNHENKINKEYNDDTKNTISSSSLKLSKDSAKKHFRHKQSVPSLHSNVKTENKSPNKRRMTSPNIKSLPANSFSLESQKSESSIKHMPNNKIDDTNGKDFKNLKYDKGERAKMSLLSLLSNSSVSSIDKKIFHGLGKRESDDDLINDREATTTGTIMDIADNGNLSKNGKDILKISTDHESNKTEPIRETGNQMFSNVSDSTDVDRTRKKSSISNNSSSEKEMRERLEKIRTNISGLNLEETSKAAYKAMQSETGRKLLEIGHKGGNGPTIFKPGKNEGSKNPNNETTPENDESIKSTNSKNNPSNQEKIYFKYSHHNKNNNNNNCHSQKSNNITTNLNKESATKLYQNYLRDPKNYKDRIVRLKKGEINFKHTPPDQKIMGTIPNGTLGSNNVNYQRVYCNNNKFSNVQKNSHVKKPFNNDNLLKIHENTSRLEKILESLEIDLGS
ncbi:unnamed protein product [Gordionus sp. m RMFG-2023]